MVIPGLGPESEDYGLTIILSLLIEIKKEIWSLYVMLTDVEDSFRSMKSELGIRPNFHQKDRRIKGHVFITILAYHVVNSIQRKLHAKDIYMRWDTIRKFLSSQVRGTTEMTTKDGSRIWIRNTSEAETFHLSRNSQLFQGEMQKFNFYHIKFSSYGKFLSCRRRNRKGTTISNC